MMLKISLIAIPTTKEQTLPIEEKSSLEDNNRKDGEKEITLAVLINMFLRRVSLCLSKYSFSIRNKVVTRSSDRMLVYE